MNRIIIFLLIIFQLISCGSNPELTEKDKEQIREEVKTTLEDYLDDIRTSGFMAELKYLDSSEDFFWTPPGYTHPISYDSVVKVLRLNAPLYKKIDNRFESLKIVPLSKELASFSALLKSTMTDTSGKKTSFRLVETGVLIKRKDSWKLLHGQTGLVSQ